MSYDLAALDGAYESAEATFLAAVRGDHPRDAMADAATAVAAAASAWNAEAYRLLHASQGDDRDELNLLTERTEVLSELWSDLAAAFSLGPSGRT